MFRFFVNSTYVLAMLVIVAGGVVRMSGSGMGCPDWPKCFGQYIPPTDISELHWQPVKYDRGQMILHEGRLYKAVDTFTATRSIDLSNWELFEDHTYSEYNVMHTYIEYLNRLTGALLGFSCLLMVITSFRAENKGKAVLTSIGVLVLIGFEGWLGAVVVESVLTPYKITMHMLVAFVIIGALVWMRTWNKEEVILPAGRGRGWVWLAIILLTSQIVLGTQVREQIDEFIKQGMERAGMIAAMDWMFYIHRTYSALVGGLILWSCWNIYKRSRRAIARTVTIRALLITLVAIGSGVGMAYFAIPAYLQPIHLVFSALLFSVVTSLAFRLRRS